MLDTLKVFRSQIEALLQPGERALFCGMAAYFAGHEELGVAAGEGADAVDVLLGVASPRMLERADQLVTGTSLLGWPGCRAQQLAAAVRRTTQSQLLVTDRRLAVLDTTDFTLLWDCPRADVLRVRRRGRLGQAGRVVLQLADGSALALVLGTLGTGRARRLVHALEQG
ncbi:hypothetical protein GC722_10230 [Auraticoccus sp. F435]|uniref:YokE-like PH domain-containing protein n=1 Tax=Auraticoccus cholistanensis TaxID=2656650 RepID=A0A6A9UY66_9ACTN|nr:hypothetical protein [Auraticoccus cholistanensis]MVA76397.1 hypothetical protein [Auraticoccus cholistanensis]